MGASVDRPLFARAVAPLAARFVAAIERCSEHLAPCCFVCLSPLFLWDKGKKEIRLTDFKSREKESLPQVFVI